MTKQKTQQLKHAPTKIKQNTKTTKQFDRLMIAWDMTMVQLQVVQQKK